MSDNKVPNTEWKWKTSLLDRCYYQDSDTRYFDVTSCDQSLVHRTTVSPVRLSYGKEMSKSYNYNPNLKNTHFVFGRLSIQKLFNPPSLGINHCVQHVLVAGLLDELPVTLDW